MFLSLKYISYSFQSVRLVSTWLAIKGLIFVGNCDANPPINQSWDADNIPFLDLFVRIKVPSSVLLYNYNYLLWMNYSRTLIRLKSHSKPFACYLELLTKNILDENHNSHFLELYFLLSEITISTALFALSLSVYLTKLSCKIWNAII